MRNKVSVVTGAASGIGAALTEALVSLGAQVHAIDIAPIAAEVNQTIECDLGDRSAIDDALGELPAVVDAVFNCAGVPNGGRFSTAQVMAINWLGLRHMTEGLVDRMPTGSSITHVASTAGRGWPAHEAELRSLMHADTFDRGAEWVDAHLDLLGDGYAFSKEAVQWYTMVRSIELLPERGIRMNSICPGVTDTQIADDFRRGVGDDVIDRAVAIAGRLARPAEMAPAMVFLADEASASYINGINLNVDRGTGAAHATGAW